MSFFKKSNQNFEMAELAEEKGYYDIAISRLYYSSYQRLCMFLSNNKNKKKKDNLKNTVMSVVIGTKKPGSHEKNLIKFSEYMNNKDIDVITKFISNKVDRIKADYEENLMDKDVYYDVKKNAEFINKYIDSNNK